MPFDYRLSDKLKDIVQKLQKREPKRADILYKKIKQIINIIDANKPTTASIFFFRQFSIKKLLFLIVNFLLFQFLSVLVYYVNSVLKNTVVKSRPSHKLLYISAYLAGKLLACAADVYQSAVNFYRSTLL